MAEQVKKKLCWNCEGSVSLHLENCPYCGVYLSPTEHSHEEKSAFNPPYPSKSSKSDQLPTPPFQSEENEAETDLSEKAESNSSKGYLAPLLMFLIGTNFAIFGLAVWLFSHKGRLTLSWNEDWGPLFILIALPLLFLGGRSLLKMNEES